MTPRTPQPTSKEFSHSKNDLFSKKTRSFIYGRQFKACQGMLDFDYACTREQPSVAAIIDPFSSAPRKDFYWGSKQVFVPSKYYLKKQKLVLMYFRILYTSVDLSPQASSTRGRKLTQLNKPKFG